MNTEMLFIVEQLKDTYEGEPWFGRSIKEILTEIDESIAFEKINGQHSILELIWHMVTWKEFILSRLRNDNEKTAEYFEKNDWRELDHSDTTLWQQGLQRFIKLHNELIEVVQQQKDEILSNVWATESTILGNFFMESFSMISIISDKSLISKKCCRNNSLNIQKNTPGNLS